MNDLQTDSTPLPKLNADDDQDLSKEDDQSDVTSEKDYPNTTVAKDPRVVQLRDCSKIHIGPFYQLPDPASVKTPPPGAKSPVNSFAESQLPPENHTRALLRSNRTVDPQDFDIISSHIGHTWRELGRKMVFTTGELDNIDADNHRLTDKAYSLFTLWRDRESSQATASNLTKLLMTVKIYDAVRYLRP